MTQFVRPARVEPLRGTCQGHSGRIAYVIVSRRLAVLILGVTLAVVSLAALEGLRRLRMRELNGLLNERISVGTGRGDTSPAATQLTEATVVYEEPIMEALTAPSASR